MESGLVFNIQRYSVQDGPGIRTTVFLKGCPLRCAWCHNPEGMSSQREIYLVETLCIACGECARACPRTRNAPAEPRRPLPARVENCDVCGACVEACPSQARRLAGDLMTVEQVLQAVLSDRVFFDESNGGVTFSGGEPLQQASFLLACLQECRARGLHTAVDTCGLARGEDLLAVAPFVDLFLYDLKLIDDQLHRRYTGASNQVIIENLQTLGRVHGQIWLRVPFVPGVNDDESQLRAAAQLAARIPGVRQVNLLRFHDTGRQKYARLGLPARMQRFEKPREDALVRAAGIFHEAGLTVCTGG